MDKNEDGSSFSPQKGIFSDNNQEDQIVEYDAASDSRAAGMPHSFSARRPTKVITNASDDIVIGGSAPKPKSNKKPLIIGVIALLAIIVVAVIILLVARGSGNSDSSTQQTFNKYANYLVYGNAETSDPSAGLNNPFESQLWQVIAAGETEATTFYFDQAKVLLDRLVISIQGTDNALLASLIEMAPVQFEAARSYYLTENFNVPLMFAYASENGTDAMKEKVTSVYSEMASSTSAPLSNLANNKLESAKSIKLLLDIYQAAGCRNGDEAAQSACIANTPWSSEVVAAQDFITTVDTSNVEYEKQLIIDLFGTCQNIQSTFNPTIENNENEEAK